MSIPNQLEQTSRLSQTAKSSFGVASRMSLSVELNFSRSEHHPQAARPHLLFSPMHYEPGYAYPLIVWLHGAGSDEQQVLRVMPKISMRNFVAVAPRGREVAVQQVKKQEKAVADEGESLSLDVHDLLEGLGGKKTFYDWPQSPETIEEAERAVFECIEIAFQRCNIAKNRVFLVGFDSGGTMALRLAMLYPEYFAGVVSLCGAFPQGNLPLRQWASIRHLPTLLTVGNQSDVFTTEQAGKTLALYHAAGMPIAVRDYPCGQELTGEMLLEVNRWIMERVCG